MEHSLEELLFAAEVRRLVVARQQARTRDMSDEDAADFRQLPVNDLIEEVVAELDRFAQIIAKYREKTAAPPRPQPGAPEAT